MGLDDVRRFNTLNGNKPMDVWADAGTHETLGKCFGYAFREPDPELKVYRPHLVPREIEGPFEIGGVTWTPIRLLHGPMPVLGFRIGRLAYCTDVSFIPEESFEKLRDLDVLVLDALQHKPHSTHFNLEQAITAAQRIGAKRTYFTHIAHALRHEETNRELPPNVQLAFDGLRIKI
jgi:phosphoribosyl 1,2-cyclic phosphate phosphodiesterase